MVAGEIQWAIPKRANLIDVSQRITKSWIVVKTSQYVGHGQA
jgi:hypothetical protein